MNDSIVFFVVVDIFFLCSLSCTHSLTHHIRSHTYIFTFHLSESRQRNKSSIRTEILRLYIREKAVILLFRDWSSTTNFKTKLVKLTHKYNICRSKFSYKVSSGVKLFLLFWFSFCTLLDKLDFNSKSLLAWKSVGLVVEDDVNPTTCLLYLEQAEKQRNQLL